MLASGIDPRNAAEILGHANPSLTLGVCGHATSERQRQAAAVLGRVLETEPKSKGKGSASTAHRGTERRPAVRPTSGRAHTTGRRP